MNWNILLIFLALNFSLFAGNMHNQHINRLIRLLKRRYGGHRTILKTPRHPQHLPPAERMLPGHTLIRPALQMLKSSVKYPLRDADTMAVYGNLKNLGITYGKIPYRVMYSGFRRANNIVEATIAQAVRNIIKSNDEQSDTNVIFIEALNLGEESSLGSLRPELEVLETSRSDSEMDGAREILTDSAAEDEDGQARRSRFNRKQKRVKYRNRYNLEESDNSTELSSNESSETSDSSDYDKNRGNPFTTYKGKYKQNWMWNHFMDGDHMNINPYGPGFNQLGSKGVDLFFGRKWWYYNQDDFMPLR